MRKLIIVLICGTLALLGAYAGYRGYKLWKHNRMTALARGFAEKGDINNAMLSLRQALRAKPKSVEATRLMAELNEAGGLPAALIWRSRVVDLSPNTVDDRLALARLAAVARDFITATNALAGVIEANRNTSAYHNIAGSVAAAMNDLPLAESHFTQASRLEPTNHVPLLNASVIRLQSTNAQVLADTRATLRQLSSIPALRSQALRELLGDAIRHDQTNDALVLSQDLIQQTNATFRDRILRLGILKATGNPKFPSYLATCQRDAGTNLPSIYELASWQMTANGPADALSFLQTLPPIIQTNQPAALLVAKCQVGLRDWPKLQATLTKQNWGEQLEFMRHAYIARAMRGQDLLDSAKTEWELALKLAIGKPQRESLASLLTLLGQAAQWNWTSEGEDILWTVTKSFPSEKWAVQALTQALYTTGRTRPLLMLFTQEAKRNPGDLSIKNNLAMTAMLVDAQELKPLELAQEVYEKAPTNSSFTSTYAFSLMHLKKKNADALRIIEKLPPKDLEDPSIAGYYAMILQANGNREKAKKYFDLTAKAKLLPEERKLIDAARAGG
jgi:tetratricopeptide (TPR) repeat protein